MAASRLVDFLRAERTRLLERWQQRVGAVPDTDGVSRIELLAHELRTPIGSARAALTTLERTMPELAGSRAGGILQRSVGELAELVDQVLIAGSLGAGMEPHYADVDIAALLHDAEESLGYEAS